MYCVCRIYPVDNHGISYGYGNVTPIDILRMTVSFLHLLDDCVYPLDTQVTVVTPTDLTL